MTLADLSTYQRRIASVQQRMTAAGLDLLVIAAPENMHYLTGYDGWSFYLNQCLLLHASRPTPIWVGRGSDRHVAKASPVIDDADVHVYGDQYIQSATLSPYDFVADRIIEQNWQAARIGIPADDYYFSARAFTTLKSRLPEAQLQDDAQLVNWVRVIKEPKEVEAMRQAGRIAAGAIRAGASRIRPGLRRADTAATILTALTAPNQLLSGSYPGIAPLLINGEGPARPHHTWSDTRYGETGTEIIEIAGVCGRYHCPIARTVSIGRPDPVRVAAAQAQAAVLDMVARDARPGMSAGELADRCAATLEAHGFSKAGRFGYSTGIAYPPDWGEHTVSVRAGETTPLQAGMTLFFIPGLWGDDWSVAVGETFHLHAQGAERMTDSPYDLIVV
jgi:ectoine hydrolase